MSIGSEDDGGDHHGSLQADLRDMAAMSPALLSMMQRAGAEPGRWYQISLHVQHVHDEVSMAGMSVVPSSGPPEDF